MDTSDAVLWQRWVRDRDADAFNEIVGRHGGWVLSACRRVLRNASDAEEVAQECFLHLATARLTLRASLTGYLHSLATSRALDRLRSDRRRAAREKAYSRQITSADEPDWDDVLRHVDEAIATLPARLREPLVRHYIGREPYQTIAQQSGMSRATATRRVAQGVEAVRRRLRRAGVVTSVVLLTGILDVKLAEATPLPAGLSAALGKAAVAGAGARAAAGAGWLFKTALLASCFLAVAGGTLWLRRGIAGENRWNSDASRRASVAYGNEAQAPGQAPPTTGRVEGFVRAEPKDERLGGVTVEARSRDGGHVITTRSEDSGHFALDGLVRGTAYFVQATNGTAGYDVPEARPVTFKATDRQASVDIALRKLLVFTGRVTIADFDPAKASAVEASRVPLAGIPILLESLEKPATRQVVTDEQGIYRVEIPFLGETFRLSCLLPDTISALGEKTRGLTTPYEIPEVHNFRFIRGTYVNGRVTNAQGAPISGARITGSGFLQQRRPWELPAETVSGVDGRYRLPHVEPGDHFTSLLVEAEGYGGYRKNVRVPYTVEAEGVDFILEPWCSVAGRVVDWQGAPAYGRHVRLRMSPEPLAPGDDELLSTVWMNEEPAVTDGEGRFVLRKVPAGAYTFEVTENSEGRNESVNPENAPLVLKAGENVTDYTLRLPDPKLAERTTIAGQVVDESGEPVPEAQVKCETPAGDEYGFQSVDKAGRFRIEGIPASTVHVKAWELLYRDDKEATYGTGVLPNVAAGTMDVRIVLPKASSVSGTLYDPVSGNAVTAEQSDVQGDRPSEGARLVFLPGSSFTVTGLAPGVYDIRLGADGYLPVTFQDVRVRAGEDTSGLTATLARGASLQGNVRVRGELPPRGPGGIIDVVGVPMGATGEAFSVGAHINYSNGSIVPGTYRVAAYYRHNRSWHRSSEVAVVTLTAEDDVQQDFNFPAGAKVQGNVEAPEGCHSAFVGLYERAPSDTESGETAEVSAHKSLWVAERGMPIACVLCGPGGGPFVLTDVPPGSYTLAAAAVKKDSGEIARSSSVVTVTPDGADVSVSLR